MFENLLKLFDTMGVGYNRISDNEIIVPCPAFAASDMLSSCEKFRYLPTTTTTRDDDLEEKGFSYISSEACVHILYEEQYEEPLSWTIILGEEWEEEGE
jgi:hypothetical protein